MRDAVGWTWEVLASRMQPFDPIREPRADDLRRRVTDTIEVTGDGWTTHDGALSIRFARTRTASADVVSAFVAPVMDVTRNPIIAAQWVVIGPRVHVAVLDVEVVGPPGDLAAEVMGAMGPLARPWPTQFDVPPREAWPPWFARIASPFALFAATEAHRIGELRDALEATVDRVIDRFYAHAQRGPGPEHPAVLAYKRHHDEHSPSRKMLVPKLGEAWTERFLAAHFGPVVTAESETP